MILQLSDVSPQELPKTPRSRSGLYHHAAFLEKMNDRKVEDEKVTQTLFLRRDNLAPGAVFHKNYMEYLMGCWDHHRGVVITPDILWYSLLCEVAGLIAENPEDFRSLFSTSKERQEIHVPVNASTDVPLAEFTAEIQKRAPSNTGVFLPEFSTSTWRSQEAMLAAFCDAVSPFYSYWTFCCGFPAIDVKGTPEDWGRLYQAWLAVADLLRDKTTEHAWMSQVEKTLAGCQMKRCESSWWKEMFEVELCGSGGEVALDGWFTRMFRQQPQGVRKPVNFATHISCVNYTFQSSSKMVSKHGIFSSTESGIFLVPEFGSCVLEKREVTSEPVRGWQDSEAAVLRFLERIGESSKP